MVAVAEGCWLVSGQINSKSSLDLEDIRGVSDEGRQDGLRQRVNLPLMLDL